MLELYKLVRPVTLAEMKSRWGWVVRRWGGATWADLWEDRPGDDQGSAEKVSVVF